MKTALRFRKAVCGALCSGFSRALKTPHRGVFAPRYAERGARAVLVPDGAPIRSVPGNYNKKTALRFRKAVCGALCSGLSRALKTPHRGVFAPRYAERGARAVLAPRWCTHLQRPGKLQ